MTGINVHLLAVLVTVCLFCIKGSGADAITAAQDPKCTSRWSALSASDDDAMVEIKCNDDEVMTGCNSYLPNGNAGTRDGEYIKADSGGKPVCVAQNGYEGKGVRAIARCCKWQDMQCYYIRGDKSECTDDSRSTASCDIQVGGHNPYPTDCMAYTNWREIDGALPDAPDQKTELSSFNSMKCFAQNGYGGAGVWSYAACCSAPDMICKEKWSPPSGSKHGDFASVTCDNGWTMTGCMSYTFWKYNDGAYIDHFDLHQDAVEDACKAVNGGNDNSVWAIAVCCKTELA
ncbi:proprotein convertase subtilisin/kexin type 9-like [Saccoglossus kowalevskii]|uniref:Proprotein convertase subtilisin/kexin type 9-like isoform X2 n=1 Tax=Saccoglossus kowalevskii TaxID=10224 RepID=A0ABM0MS29_SACKO|nr:PREDICTED: proprotein convertase subtilisin/kexin type 9-like isoform X2 [Saccoglossus kowalevskii]